MNTETVEKNRQAQFKKLPYGRLRMLTGNEGNREKLLKIITDGKIASDIIEKFSVDDLQNEKYFTSLLFYLGMLTVGETKEEQSYLKIPNYSMQTLYWEYIASYPDLK